ncbi:uncharacterized protein PV07_06556 [Cladophialophora immunda]|uniref:Uncharacterized protein n=1 Tax=Cladophialophora immunda TaxID=569365 RepID=A0A0D2ANS7_9EURO|nr:uncharacterized protein PV07_06556 [Cladophialophora immunda]KIW26747.1 hypothetical protein PV07_06556 [Cladophialophora immunda]
MPGEGRRSDVAPSNLATKQGKNVLHCQTNLSSLTPDAPGMVRERILYVRSALLYELWVLFTSPTPRGPRSSVEGFSIRRDTFGDPAQHPDQGLKTLSQSLLVVETNVTFKSDHSQRRQSNYRVSGEPNVRKTFRRPGVADCLPPATVTVVVDMTLLLVRSSSI